MKVVLIAALFLGACDVGEVAPGVGATGPDAAITNTTSDNGGEQSFTATVSPLVQQHQCLTCHGTGQAPNLTSFDLLDPKYKAKPGAQNILVTKGAHEGIQWFTAAEQADIASWIDDL